MIYDLIVEEHPAWGNMGLSLLLFIPLMIIIQIAYHIAKRYNIIERYFSYIASAVIIVYLLSATIPGLLYIYDYNHSNVSQKTKEVIAYQSDRNGSRILTDKGRVFRIFSTNRSKFDNMDEAFANHKCEIYYYRLSRYVYKVVVLDNDE